MAIYIAPDDIPTLENTLSLFERNPEVLSILFLMADHHQYTSESLDPLLKKMATPIIGGVFPEVIFQGQRKTTGIVLLPLLFKLETQLFDLSQSCGEINLQLEQVPAYVIDPDSSLFVFTDALSQNKACFMECIFNFFGVFSTYIGGGAGSLKFENFPCIITNTGLFANAAVIGWAKKKIAIGVAHGWQAITNPLKVTQSNRNELVSINWKPAFEIYKDIVESHSGMKFTHDNFFEIAKSYPLGIARLDAEMVVRDPFKASGEVLYLIDEINQGEYIKVLHGNMDALLWGASNARSNAFSKIEESMDEKAIFCIDCISRVLYMQNDFKKELEVIRQNVNLTGILTIGEIANSEDSFLEIYNKTVVIGIW